MEFRRFTGSPNAHPRLKRVVNVSALTIFLVLSAIVTYCLTSINGQMGAQFRADAAQRTALLSRLFEHSIVISDYHEISVVAQSLIQDAQFVSIEVLDRNGDKIASYSKPLTKNSELFETESVIHSSFNRESIGKVKITYTTDYLSGIFVRQMVLAIGSLAAIFILSMLLFTLLFRSIGKFFSELLQQFQNLLGNQQAQLATVPYFMEFFRISNAFNRVAKQLDDLRENEREQSKLVATAEIAAQVAHDIRSPLTALYTVCSTLPAVPEQERHLLRAAITRINDIANNLLARRNAIQASSTEEAGKHSISLPAWTIVENIVTEKRMQYRDRQEIQIESEWDETQHSAFISLSSSDMGRVLSNIINNAVEAIESRGKIKVDIRGDTRFLKIKVMDNGKGIPPDVLPKIFLKNMSIGKANGVGLGLYHAQMTIEKCGGRVEVESKVGMGTVVSLFLPKMTPPIWHVAQLSLAGISKVIIVDDEPNIHQVWNARFRNLGLYLQTENRVEHFYTSQSLEKWVRRSSDEIDHFLFLVDDELIGSEKRGLELIKDLAITKRSILVTSRHDEARVQEECLRLELSLLPKNMVNHIPIVSI